MSLSFVRVLLNRASLTRLAAPSALSSRRQTRGINTFIHPMRILIMSYPKRTIICSFQRHTEPNSFYPPGNTKDFVLLNVKDFGFDSVSVTEEKVSVHFVNRDGKHISVTALTGNSILDVVVDQNLDFDGFGACEGTLACSTCHVILEEDVYKKLGSISDEEMDMLDLAYGLTDTSRLGCQVCLRKDLDGMILRVPESVADVRVASEQESTT